MELLGCWELKMGRKLRRTGFVGFRRLWLCGFSGEKTEDHDDMLKGKDSYWQNLKCSVGEALSLISSHVHALVTLSQCDNGLAK
jgi:hypothetical protein